MRAYRIYEKMTGFYLGTVLLTTKELRNMERDFIIKEA